MLPKIIVASTYDKKSLVDSLGLSPSVTMEYEGSEGKVDALRHFINFGVNVSSGSKSMNLVIWDADRLSAECQTVLLKPLEDSSDRLCLVLIVSNENGLLPTVLSRCVVSSHEENSKTKTEYWKSVRECLSIGPAKCLAFADELDKNETEEVLLQVIEKLKSGLEDEVNANRLKILKLAIDCLAKIRFTNVNTKLVFGNFLITAWRLVK